jgi:hypothetical protein
MSAENIPSKMISEIPLDPPLPAKVIQNQLRDRAEEERQRKLEEATVAKILDGE